MQKLIQYLIIHCTATAEGRAVSSDEIRYWHLKDFGWKQVGYTDLIHLDGTLENLVPNNGDQIKDKWEITNRVRGMNTISRSIVYVGGTAIDCKTPKDTRTLSQKITMAEYVINFIHHHPTVKVAAHYNFANKACPCFNVELWLKSIGVNEVNYKL